ncbi:MAG: methionine adenosyltransferase [Actinobacteria bacterium]|jgi:S-adenosylmethionine synthetase|uniref:methionine adenosyltransferase n=1 Tax=freshwater metagenome TaxID=449393 RepID=A0A6J6LNK3_9ZZZZ|nr:methionine adenosyltransferase [Actinomycetota bacterium]MSZ17321.1 methionine adenosyltransferase [Actinomycetota bacterium]
MSKLRQFTSESVTEGHPDKICDQISDAILDAMLAQDKDARVAVETMVTTGLVHVAGEVSTSGYVEIPSIVRDTVLGIGYNSSKIGFDGKSCGVSVSIGQQSPDIAQGVDSGLEVRNEGSTDRFESQGAGDQGIMFGYASNETPTYMPTAIALSHKLSEKLASVRKSGEVSFLRPDGKTQVTVGFDGSTPKTIEAVVVSSQHDDGVSEADIHEAIKSKVIIPILEQSGLDFSAAKMFINPTGKFVIGGPQGDAGLTGRKIIVDTYGGAARHGGGAFSGKDPSKVDRSAAYAMRWVAKNVVASGAADRAEVQVAYAIGVANPVGIYLETFGTEKVATASIEQAIRDIFDLRPRAIVEHLDLLRPIYSKTAAYGHFGRELPEFSWEKLDRVDALRSALNL